MMILPGIKVGIIGAGAILSAEILKMEAEIRGIPIIEEPGADICEYGRGRVMELYIQSESTAVNSQTYRSPLESLQVNHKKYKKR